MKQPRLSRRQFFKLSAFGASALASGAIGLVSVAAAPTEEALAAAQQPQSPAIPQPTFKSIASSTSFGPLTDISMGWDGTLWGIDAQGAPHVYDSINNVWAQHGDSIDVAVRLGTTLYIFKGSSVVLIDTTTLKAAAPTTIAALWPNLPDSFKLGVSGAIADDFGSTLVLFNSGRYLSTDGSIPMGKLTDLPRWPQTPTWKDGVIDGTIAGQNYLMRGSQILQIVIENKTLEIGDAFPREVLILTTPLPLDWAESGIDAWAPLGSTTSLIFKGTAVLSYDIHTNVAAPLSYVGNLIGNWPATWHPVLAHAPNGRDGNLWSVLPGTHGNWIMQHNGDTWQQVPNQADHVGVGQDNTVMIASASRLFKFNGRFDGYGFDPVSPVSNLIQVSLGNANFVNARDTSGNVYSFNPSSGALTPNTDVGTVAHIATTNDGSLWHAKPSDPNMHRQLIGSGVQPEAIQVKQTLVSAVNKVAATGFGAAHCLATDHQGNTDAYRYDSPYVFKTATQYNVYGWVPTVIERGAGLLFMIDTVLVSPSPNPLTRTQIVALDAHTGVEVARTPMLDGTLEYGQPVFDPNLNLVYVATAPRDDDDNSPGQLMALDPHTLAVKWSYYTLAGGIDAAPALLGTQLCVGSRAGGLMLFNTAAALANPANVRPMQIYDVSDPDADANRVATPIFAPDEGRIYVMSWSCTRTNGSWNAQGTWNSFDLNGGGSGNPIRTVNNVTLLERLLTPPVRGMFNLANTTPAKLSPAFAINCYDAVIVAGGSAGIVPALTFNLPAGQYIQTGFAFDMDADAYEKKNGHALWFGSGNGTLYGLDVNLDAFTSFTQVQNGSMNTTPGVYKDTMGGTTILYNTFGVGAANQINSLYGYDPANGNTASLPTGATIIGALSRSVTNGMIYAAGLIYNYQTSAGLYPQVFGIRLDELAQDLRDFIIESQLMQDPQNPGGTGGSAVTAPDGNIIPPSVARYQTHLTVVDDKKTPQPKELVKIWADVDGTVITVNNKQYTIGPADSAFAQVTTGVDGAVVIVSDATDVNTSALRVWASFMDPYERIVVYPDHEWHGRAAQTNANGTVADPTKPNLNTAYSYKPDSTVSGSTTAKPLFNDDEKNQGTPANVASAVSQMNTGLNPGGNSPATVAGALKTLHASNPDAPYVAYSDLSGMHYGPNNARAKRTATISQPIGFALNKPQGGTHSYTPLSHSDARSAIDALDGQVWDPTNPSGKPNGAPVILTVRRVRRTDDVFTDFWNWLVGAFNAAVDAIENVIVSVADDIMVGINFIIDGVKQAFKAIIKVIDDVVNAIGSFFLQLAKLIEEVIEALSLLFHFGEIMWTHRWLAGQVNQRITDLQTAITNTIVPNIDAFFQLGEEAIAGFFDSLKAEFSAGNNPQLSNMRGYGQTPHTAFTITPKGGTPSSQATQCTWGTDKAKSGTPSATVTNPTARAAVRSAPLNTGPSAPSADPISDFSKAITDFIARLSNDPQLSQATTQLKNDFNNLVQVNSTSQFFSQLMVTLLDLIKTLMISALAIGNALIDAIADAISDALAAVNNVLNAEIEIPILTWLYETLFSEKLTLLNIVTLVAAIPVTLIFRLVQGQYPSQAGLPSAGMMQINRAQVAPGPALIAFGVFVGICQLVEGFSNAIGDNDDGGSPVPGYVSLVCGTLAEIFSFPLIGSAPGDVSSWDWAVYGFEVFEVIFLLAGLPYIRVDGTPNEPASTQFMSFGSLILNLGLFALAITAYIKDGKTDGLSNIEFAETIIEAVVGAINPLKLTGFEGAVVVGLFDAFGGVIEMFMTLFTALAENTSAEPLRTYYFPWVALNSPPPGTAEQRRPAQPFLLGTASQ